MSDVTPTWTSTCGDLVISWPRLSDELMSTIDVVRRFTAEVVAPCVGQIETDLVVPPALDASLVDTGWWALDLPASVGGSEGGLVATAVVVAELSCASPVVGVRVALASLLSPRATGVDEALATIAAGGRLALVDARSPLVAIQSHGDGLDLAAQRLDGGHDASVALVLHDGGPLIIEGSAWEGRQTSEPLETTGLRGLGSACVRLTGPTRAVTGIGTDDLRGRWQLLLTAVALGIAAAASTAAGEHVRERRQFGRALIEFGAVRAMWERGNDVVASLPGAVVAACESDDRGASSEAAERLVRVAASDAVTISATAIQLHGGYGFIEEYPVARLFRDAVSVRAIASGSASHLD